MEIADAMYREYIRCHLKTKRVYTQESKKIETIEHNDILLHTFMPCSKKKSDRYQTAFNSVYKQGHSLETLRIVDCMQKVDKLLKILLTPDQLLLFSLIPMYEIDYFNSHVDAYDFAPFDFELATSFKYAAERLNGKELKSDIDINLLKHTAFLLDSETLATRRERDRNTQISST